MEGFTFYFDWEVSLLEWLQGIFNTPFLVSLASFASILGEQLVAIGVLGILYLGFNKEMGRFVGINIVANVVFNPMIKNGFLRRRPYFDNPSVKILKPVEPEADIYDIAAQGYSFPSGHSSSSATVFGSLAVKMNKKWVRIVFLVIPFLVGISRQIVGAHYPTDVLCGWLLGALIILFIPFIRKKIKNDYVFWGTLLVASTPGFFYCTSNDYFTGYGILIGAAASFVFDDKVVHFENTRNVFRCILRTLGGAVIYLALNSILKLPFSSEFLESGTFLAHIVRVFRYAIVVFAVCGAYPMVFKYTAKIGKKAE